MTVEHGVVFLARFAASVRAGKVVCIRDCRPDHTGRQQTTLCEFAVRQMHAGNDVGLKCRVTLQTPRADHIGEWDWLDWPLRDLFAFLHGSLIPGLTIVGLLSWDRVHEDRVAAALCELLFGGVATIGATRLIIVDGEIRQLNQQGLLAAGDRDEIVASAILELGLSAAPAKLPEYQKFDRNEERSQ